MCCSPLLATGCKTTESIAVPVKPPPQRLACEGLPASRPAIPPEYVIDWNAVLVPGDAIATRDRARAEHLKFVASIRTREGVVSGYLVQIEGRLFVCSDNAAWLREFFAKLPDPPAQ